MRRALVLPVFAAIALSACAQKSEKIPATYVSPTQYQSFSCRQLRDEADRVSQRAAQVMGVQDKRANNDAGIVAVSAIVFWPAVFFVKGNREGAAEVANLKGQMVAIQDANVQKSCGIEFQPVEPVAPNAAPADDAEAEAADS